MRRDRTVGSMTALTNEESSGRSPSPFHLGAPAWAHPHVSARTLIGKRTGSTAQTRGRPVKPSPVKPAHPVARL